MAYPRSPASIQRLPIPRKAAVTMPFPTKCAPLSPTHQSRFCPASRSCAHYLRLHIIHPRAGPKIPDAPPLHAWILKRPGRIKIWTCSLEHVLFAPSEQRTHAGRAEDWRRRIFVLVPKGVRSNIKTRHGKSNHTHSVQNNAASWLRAHGISDRHHGHHGYHGHPSSRNNSSSRGTPGPFLRCAVSVGCRRFTDFGVASTALLH